jgi:hypothetical protein
LYFSTDIFFPKAKCYLQSIKGDIESWSASKTLTFLELILGRKRREYLNQKKKVIVWELNLYYSSLHFMELFVWPVMVGSPFDTACKLHKKKLAEINFL